MAQWLRQVSRASIIVMFLISEVMGLNSSPDIPRVHSPSLKGG